MHEYFNINGAVMGTGRKKQVENQVIQKLKAITITWAKEKM